MKQEKKKRSGFTSSRKALVQSAISEADHARHACAEMSVGYGSF